MKTGQNTVLSLKIALCTVQKWVEIQYKNKNIRKVLYFATLKYSTFFINGLQALSNCSKNYSTFLII